MNVRKWVKQEDPNNKYGATFTLGDKHSDLPKEAIVSVTRGENFTIPRLMINGILNQFIMKTLAKNENLIYAELTGQLQGGVGQTLTVWKDPKLMNTFRTRGFHQFSRRFFSWVFYSGRVKAYFHTWKVENIPTSQEAGEIVVKNGRYFKGGKLIRKASHQNND
ncbi:hypothetical protein [Niallia oryzisoli]|uniref:hypothetical protein n=1 Tax=Niallia oryzisoli TaxID=1737571 RepID=UPI003736EE47